MKQYTFNGITYNCTDSNRAGYIILSGTKNEYLHRIHYTNMTGIEIDPGFEVHHLDHNKMNNDIRNLEVVSKATHRRMHKLLKYNKIRVISPDGSSREFDTILQANRYLTGKETNTSLYRKARKEGEIFVFKSYVIEVSNKKDGE